MAKRRCSTSLIIREMQKKKKKKQLQGTTSYQLEGPSLKSLQITNARKGVEKKGTLLHC